MSVGANIRRIRERNGMTQSELADKAGITQAMLCWIEQGNRKAA